LGTIRIHQFHQTAASSDAITNQMFLIRESLRETNVESEIFASDIRTPHSKLVKSFPSQEIKQSDLLLIHHSQRNPYLRTLLKLKVPKVMMYHNITPSSFFTHDYFTAKLCKEGRKQLPLLKKSVVASLAASDYSLGEKRGWGNIMVHHYLRDFKF